ncbi:hypothetical protein SASPL_143788 [Salvia splendens]|uniref:Uncharacterized protein n=1 Tax=Salvia splendens TaxID=180675 RepID=A0A8X8ZAN0_SALSN|nr:hypothetical protein SASPL_143788 [Salvia splendens]
MWIVREEEILATCLLDLVARGGKSDNGFRAGSLRNILSRTDVGFNPDGDHRIDCDDEQWEQIVQYDINDNSSGNEERMSSTTKVGGQKRKVVSTDDSLVGFLSKLHAETNSRLDVMSSRIGYEFDLDKARHEVFDKLGTY